MSETVDCVVIGAGVVGLAVARELALAGQEVIILEKAGLFGSETSSRNSEVIHAGIYYPSNSSKAALCVDGARRLYEYCASRGIEHQRLGKLIVATSDDQVGELEKLQAKGRANGVAQLDMIDGAAAKRMEPEIDCIAALHSPNTGIVDSHNYMLSLLGEAEAAGAFIAYNSPVLSGEVQTSGVRLAVGGAEPMQLTARLVVNSAGLWAQGIASRIDGFPPEHIPGTAYAKGNYFSLAGKSPFTRLIYPAPEVGGLGIHATLDLGGQCRFGPDVEWCDGIDYTLDARRSEKFYAAIRKYWPRLKDDTLLPAYVGVRPKLYGRDGPATDFLISGPADHGIASVINLFGIESPGLTASLAIARQVAQQTLRV
jgi:L-2-hydroxyglutarate oxidase LhgO